ncbi:hypothetical protein ILUMI_15384 [Ignelater luminosus]|uniref:H15 domain-containing protein n=1 Tax=Ignelater luminosus TaxID=2038154 RepID=A0A8K0G959_IGNLU|nr:hypothetical protein ILUMI_15384 [Ignelater luminosus]
MSEPQSHSHDKTKHENHREERKIAAVIMEALCEMQTSKRPNGASSSRLVAYICNNYDVPEEKLRKHMPSVMHHGLCFGVLRKENNRYRINPEFLKTTVGEVQFKTSNPMLIRLPYKICKRCQKVKRPRCSITPYKKIHYKSASRHKEIV